MALKSREATPSTGGLSFKKRSSNSPKKVMIYGNDGTGKSTFAETYCEKNDLNPVVIDIDDTNYTNLPIVDLEFTDNDRRNFMLVKDTIIKASQTEEIDTIILDGVTSLLEMLVSSAKGLKKYSDRAERFNEILLLLQNSRKNIIYIGQADMKVIYTEDHQSNKAVIKVNSIVNEKYHCYIGEKGQFKVETEKYRSVPSSD